ncbi:Regulator of phospholipase D SRF1 [Stagonosporopsis vannaccii]|nr:Regulator of phospholipase D SRF1 [Stagonosporopsis vannaccii]
MASKPMAERTKSDHGSNAPSNGHRESLSFLSPNDALSSTTAAATSHPPTTSSTLAGRPGAASLLPSPIPPPSASSQSSQHRPHSRVSVVSGLSRDDQSESAVRKSHSHSISSTPRTLASSKGTSSTAADNRERQRAARSLPPWVQSADEDEIADATSLLLPRTPTSVRPASHNYMPTPKSNVPGRRFDHVREGAPVTLTTPVSQNASKWKQFAAASNYEQHDRPISSRGQIVDDDWMTKNMPDLEKPWEPIDEEEKEEKIKGFWIFSTAKRRRKMVLFHRTVMNHPMVPALVRCIVLTFSILALSLAGAIFHKSDSAGCENNSSTWMAIIVDVVAIVYTCYITYDEYTSKPLGLRSHNAKMSLIFLDLAFIVFESANLSLAFQALTDDKWACRDAVDRVVPSCEYSRSICVRQKALTATLLIALLAWLATFSISTLR